VSFNTIGTGVDIGQFMERTCYMPCRCVPAVDISIYREAASEEGKQVQAYFNRRGVAYEDYDISSDPVAFAQMQKLSGQKVKPVVVINDRVLVGFLPEQFDLLVPSLHY
jgi:arsenate reductase-like glutaredoxin family protein